MLIEFEMSDQMSGCFGCTLQFEGNILLLESDKRDSKWYANRSNTLFSIWAISFEQVRRTQPSAARLLAFMSCFHNQGIPIHLLYDYRDEVQSDDSDFDADVSTLQEYCLINVRVQGTLEMHRLVQMATRKWLAGHDELKGWQERYIRTMEKAFPKAQYDNWPQCQMLFPHIEKMLQYGTMNSDSLRRWATVLFRASCYAVEQGWYRKAETMAQASMQAAHPHSSIHANHLASIYRSRGQLAKAEALETEALSQMPRSLDGEYPDTLTGMDNLAITYHSQGRLLDAEALVKRALETRVRILGADHPNTLISMANLAMTFQSQGRLLEAMALQEDVLALKRRILGEDHPDTLISMANLAISLQFQGRLLEAIRLQGNVLALRKQILGQDHPDTLTSMVNLAISFQSQGRLGEAMALQENVLALRNRILGQDHLDTLTTMDNLAAMCQLQGHSPKARTLLEKLLELRKRILGQEHPDTLKSTNDLAYILSNQGTYKTAETMYQHTLAVMKRELGPENSATLTIMNNLAYVLSHLGMYQPAEELYRQTSTAMKKVLGAEDPFTLISMKNLADVLIRQGAYEEAETMLQRTLISMEMILGEKHLFTLVTMMSLGEVFMQAGSKQREAETLVLLALTGLIEISVMTSLDVQTDLDSLNSVLCRSPTKSIRVENLLWFARFQKTQTSVVYSVDIRRGLDSLTAVLARDSKSKRKDFNKDEKRGSFYAVLQLAALYDTTELVEQLIEKRIKIDFLKVKCRKALQIAANNGQLSITRLLLSDAANTVSEDALYPAVRAASSGGHKAVVRLLLDAGAIHNLKLENLHDAVQAASASGHVAVVRLLLKRAVNNQKGNDYTSAFHAAAAGGHEAVVRLLLKRGGNAHTTQDDYGCALQAASRNGHEGVVVFLLDRQVDVTAQLGHYGNALQAAYIGDHQSLVRLLTDHSVLFSFYSDSEIFRGEGDTASSLSGLAPSISPTLSLATYDLSFATLSATSFENELPEHIFTILTHEILLNPDVKVICQTLLALRGTFAFVRIFKRSIREFCTSLSRESPTDVTRVLIWILRRFEAYFSYRVCQILKPSSTRKEKQIEGFVDQTVESGVEKYLQNLRVNQPRRDAIVARLIGESSGRKIVGSDDRTAKHHPQDGGYREVQTGENDVSDKMYMSFPFLKKDTSDEERDMSSQSLTNETISWLTRSAAFLNFKHNMNKYDALSPLRYVHHVIQPRLPASEMCSVTFHIQWELLQYTKKELEEGDTIFHVLTVSGGTVDAEATSCLDYCQRLWPKTGEFVVMALEKAIKKGRHGKYSIYYSEAGS